MGKKSKKDGGSPTDELHWTAEMDAALIDGLLYQMNIGNRVNGTFTCRAYAGIVIELAEKFGKDINKDKVKNRLKTIKKKFNDCYDIFKEGKSGFGWSEAYSLWTAEPEVWDPLIKAKPEAQKWMTTPMPNYFKMSQLWAKDRATGDYAETAKEKRARLATTNSVTIEDIDNLVSQNEVNLENSEVADGEQRVSPESDAARCLGISPDVNSSKGKKRKTSEMDKNDEIVEAIFGMNDVLKEGNSILARSLQRVISEEDVWANLEVMELGPYLMTKAYAFLVQNPPMMRAFFGCPATKRKDVLLDLMSDN